MKACSFAESMKQRFSAARAVEKKSQLTTPTSPQPQLQSPQPQQTQPQQTQPSQPQAIFERMRLKREERERVATAFKETKTKTKETENETLCRFPDGWFQPQRSPPGKLISNFSWPGLSKQDQNRGRGTSRKIPKSRQW